MEESTLKKDVIIIGAGLVGCLLSISLIRRRYNVKIYEKRGYHRDLDNEKITRRSINLALSERGIEALEAVGLLHEINKLIIPMKGRKIHNPDDSITYQEYGQNGEAIYSISRNMMNNKLIELAESEGVRIFFNHKLLQIDWDNNHVIFETDGKNNIVEFNLLFGADGANSQTRLEYIMSEEKFNFNKSILNYDYKELYIPPASDGDFAMDHNALHIWPRKNFLMIASPNIDKSFTATIFLSCEGEESFKNLNTIQQINDFFEKNFKDIIKFMPNYVEEFLTNPISKLFTIECYPWIKDGKFALIGDSAHAMVPFYGQGMNCCFEDCRILSELIDKHDHYWEDILEEYQSLRFCDSKAIQEMSFTNMIELREKICDPKFLLQKKIEANIHHNYPTKFVPLYSLVAFTPDCRYSDALEKGKKQDDIMQEIMKIEGIKENWQSEEIQNLILIKLQDHCIDRILNKS